jgi:hypothetical protein|tara:strand:+ start:1324 stop:2001 length:678 start_codon:yes stop_codon:yes gene_type:complete
LANVVIVAALETDPYPAQFGNDEYLEVCTTTPGQDGFGVVLRARTSSEGPSNFLKTKRSGDLVCVSGELTLGSKDTQYDGIPIVRVFSVSDANEKQYINEVTIVGRFVKTAKEANLSCSRSVAVNRYVGKEQITNFFRIRGFGKLKDRIIDAPKGTLVEIVGSITGAKNKEGKFYTEIKTKRLQTHERGSGGAVKADPAKELSAAGYEHSQFQGNQQEDSIPSNW